jgi:probable HAF family extracellular repeat protein
VTLKNLSRSDLFFALLLAAALLLPARMPAQSGNYSFMNIDYPGAIYTQVSGGHIVGYYFGNDGIVHGFVDTGSGLTPLDYPGADATGPAGINNSGEITGYHNDGTGTHGFIYSNGVFSSFDCPGAEGQTNPHGINNSGVVVGVCNGAFVYTNGSFSYIAYPDKFDTIAFGINDSGAIAGTYRDSDAGNTHGFLYSGGTYTPLDFPDQIQTYALGINNGGAVVGYANSFTNSEGFVYRNGQFTPLDPSTPLEAYGISNTGKIDRGALFPFRGAWFCSHPGFGNSAAVCSHHSLPPGRHAATKWRRSYPGKYLPDLYDSAARGLQYSNDGRRLFVERDCRAAGAIGIPHHLAYRRTAAASFPHELLGRPH